MVTVACVQLEVSGTEGVESRTARALETTLAATEQADIVLLPELWPTGAFDLTLGLENAQPLDGPLVAALADIAKNRSTWIHGGSFVEVTASGNFYNTSVLFDPSGDLLATYRKIHLFGFDDGEAAALTSGTEVVVVDTPLGRTGLTTCYDLRFPELYRALVDSGAESVVCTSGWPTARLSRWELLARARAVENQLWFVGVNAVGTHAETQMGGQSLVVDPWGEVVAEAGKKEQVLYATFDPRYVDQVRDDFPVLRDRRL